MNFSDRTRRWPRFARRVAALGLTLLLPAPALLAGSPTTPVYTLEDCLALVRRQNPDVVAASRRVDAATAAVTVAKAQLYPQVTSSGYYQYREQSLTEETSVTTTNPTTGKQTTSQIDTNRKEDYSGDVRVSQNLYSAQAVRSRIAAAKLQLEVETNTYQAQVDTSTLTARLAFYQTLYAEASIAVEQEAVNLLGSQLKDQQDRFAAGSVGQLNVNRAQVALANEQPGLLAAQSGIQTAYVALAQLLGVAYPADAHDRPFRIKGELSCPPVRMTLAECLSRAQALRPEITARKAQIDAYKRQIVVEKATTRPQVSAFAAYDIYSEPSILSTRDSFSGGTVGVQATWTLFDGFATRGRVRSAQALVGQAEAQLEGTRQQVEADVRMAFYDLQLAKETLPPLASTIRLAAETQTLSISNFNAGLADQLTVLQTRVDLTRARVTELGARLRYHQALARLERAMGMGRPTQGSTTALPVTKK